MKVDPIVEEIHQTRQTILAECHNDLTSCSTDCKRLKRKTVIE